MINLLKAARLLITTPETWCKTDAARTQDGHGCSTRDASAHSFCGIGAVMRAEFVGSISGGAGAVSALHSYVQEHFGANSFGDWNDDPTTTHADVLALFDRAIAQEGGAA